MAFHVRDLETDRVVRELASATGMSLTETIRNACEVALADVRRSSGEDDLRAKLKAIKDELAVYPNTGLKADKAFFDSLYDE